MTLNYNFDNITESETMKSCLVVPWGWAALSPLSGGSLASGAPALACHSHPGLEEPWGLHRGVGSEGPERVSLVWVLKGAKAASGESTPVVAWGLEHPICGAGAPGFGEHHRVPTPRWPPGGARARTSPSFLGSRSNPEGEARPVSRCGSRAAQHPREKLFSMENFK